MRLEDQMANGYERDGYGRYRLQQYIVMAGAGFTGNGGQAGAMNMAGFTGNGGQAGAMNMYHPGTAGPYNNSSLNRKLAAAKEWLKQRRSK